MPNHVNKVAILGSGPGAWFIQWECFKRGISPDIYCINPHRRIPGGAFWFHEIPEELKESVRDSRILSIGIGSGKRYSTEMWGLPYRSSFPRGIRSEIGWNALETSDHLWHTPHQIFIREFKSDEEIRILAKGYDVVFQTFPTFFSRRRHGLKVAKIYTFWKPATMWISDLGWSLYNGTGSGGWLRMTKLWGNLSLESLSPDDRPGWILSGSEIKLHPETIPDEQSVAPNVYQIGRFAQWAPKMLAHASGWNSAMVLNSRNCGGSSSGSMKM